jgi:hypothetical protein
MCIYNPCFVCSHDGSDTPANSTDIKVLISSFRSHVLKLKVAKKPDKLHMDLLSDDSDPNSGIWNSITRYEYIVHKNFPSSFKFHIYLLLIFSLLVHFSMPGSKNVLCSDEVSSLMDFVVEHECDEPNAFHSVSSCNG